MIQSFRDETTADLFRDRNTRAARRIPRGIWRVAQRKLLLLDSAARLENLLIPAGNRLASMKLCWGSAVSPRTPPFGCPAS